MVEHIINDITIEIVTNFSLASNKIVIVNDLYNNLFIYLKIL